MEIGIAVLQHTAWAHLHQAYDRASDTPGHRQALLEGNEEQQRRTLAHLWSE